MTGARGVRGATGVRARAAFAATGLALLMGCAEPAPVGLLPPSDVALTGRTVTWTSSRPSVGTVRWGPRADAMARVAYAAAADRADRAAVRAHAVPLLAVVAGESVYVQTLDRTTAGTVIGEVRGFRVSALPSGAPMLEWVMVDVGFGDAHLLTMPHSGRRVLIDAGERRDAANVVRFLEGEGVTALDAAIATHIHEDHIGGFVGDANVATDGVLERYAVGMMLESATKSGTRRAWDEVLAGLDAHATPRHRLEPGASDATDAALAWDPDVRVRVLNAGHGQAIGGSTESDWINNDSIVLRVTYGDASLVLGGDAETPVQRRLLDAGAALSASVLKVHHHGAADATEPAYLDAVTPGAGLIPIVTYETWDGTLPSGTVLARLAGQGVDVFANDRAGPLGWITTGDRGWNVRVRTDGRSVDVGLEPSASQHWPGEEWLAREEDER